MKSQSDERAREARATYAALDPHEKCVFAGKMLERVIYARVLAPESVDTLLTCRICGMRPSQRPINAIEQAICTNGQVCKPRNGVARQEQIAPWVADPELYGSVGTWTAMGGRGAGKSWVATSALIPDALKRSDMRIGVLGPDYGVSERVGMLGPAGFKTRIEAFDKDLIKSYDNVKKILYLANGTRIFALTAENPKSIEGPEYHAYWCDELAELPKQGGDNCIWRKRAEPGVRLPGENGEPVRKIMTGTPDATALIRDLDKSTKKYPHRYYWTTLSTKSNAANLDEADMEQRYLEAMDEDGNLNRYGQAKLEGILILESPNALLSDADLGAIRKDSSSDAYRTPEQMDEVILAVDSNHSEDKKSDECGIMVMGRRKLEDDRRIAHVFADASIAGGPKAWGERIIEALIAFDMIDTIVVEDDSSMVIEVVEGVLREQLEKIGRPIKVQPIKHGNKSKKKRADPVAVEYQIKHVLHTFDPRMPKWRLTELEWQWTSWNPKDDSKSPDRVDACVYGVTYLLLNHRESDSWG